jgi:F-type H+-transporting ATPase subunit delta
VEAQALSHKYALAIFSQAVEKWLTTLRLVQDKIAADAGLAETLSDSAKPFADKQKTLDGAIPADTDSDIRNLLYMMLREGHLQNLGEVLDELERIAKGGPAVKTAQVTTAIKLTDDEKEQFRQKLRAKHGKELEFKFVVDPAIMGGAVVQIGDKVIDGSVANRLEALGQSLGVSK